MQAIGNDPSLDNSSASVCAPRTICDDKDVLAIWDAHDASTSSDRDHISDDSSDEVLSSSTALPPVTTETFTVLEDSINLPDPL